MADLNYDQIARLVRAAEIFADAKLLEAKAISVATSEQSEAFQVLKKIGSKGKDILIDVLEPLIQDEAAQGTSGMTEDEKLQLLVCVKALDLLKSL